MRLFPHIAVEIAVAEACRLRESGEHRRDLRLFGFDMRQKRAATDGGYRRAFSLRRARQKFPGFRGQLEADKSVFFHAESFAESAVKCKQLRIIPQLNLAPAKYAASICGYMRLAVDFEKIFGDNLSSRGAATVRF